MRTATLALAVLSGCSPLFMETLPKNRTAEDTQPRCTTTKGFAIWDGAESAGYLISGVALVNYAEDQDAMRQDVPLYIPALAAAAIIASVAHFGSAMWGNQQSNRCANARDEFDARGGKR